MSDSTEPRPEHDEEGQAAERDAEAVMSAHSMGYSSGEVLLPSGRVETCPTCGVFGLEHEGEDECRFCLQAGACDGGIVF